MVGDLEEIIGSRGDRILVVAHDAGGAEIISSWVQKQRFKEKCFFLLKGPALDIFARKLQFTQSFMWDGNPEALSNFDLVITGTSWNSQLEKDVIAVCKTKGVSVITYLDHWTNYRERFNYGGKLLLPNEIWVGDKYAYNMASDLFPDTTLRLVPNQYLSDIVAHITHLEQRQVKNDNEGLKILYVCEPRTMNYGDPNYWGYTEYEALDGYLKYLTCQQVNINQIRVRLHPSEEPGKYSIIIQKYQGLFSLCESSINRLDQDCAWADWVVGCDSMAMVAALLAGKQVFSCIPANGRKLTLPYPEIIWLFGEQPS